MIVSYTAFFPFGLMPDPTHKASLASVCCLFFLIGSITANGIFFVSCSSSKGYGQTSVKVLMIEKAVSAHMTRVILG